MPYSLLGIHVNALMGGLPEAIAAWKPPLVVSLDHNDAWHGIKAKSPHTLLVGRVCQRSEPDFSDKGLDPLKAARSHCDAILPWAERMGMTYDFWQGINEPVVQSTEAMQRLCDFETERAHIMYSHGFRAVIGSFSVGNPTRMAWWNHFLPALEAAKQFKGALALHEYAWPSLHHESSWYLLRHRKVYGGEPTQQWAGLPPHLKTVPLLITECGLDGGIQPGFELRGWKARYTIEQFLRQLAWYDSELRKDAYVVGAALYCACSPDDPDWGSFSIWPEMTHALEREARPIYRLTEPPKPAPQPAPQPAPESAPVPTPEPMSQPAPEPGPETPSGEQPPQLLLAAPAAADRFQQVLRRLDRILEILQEESD